MKIEDWYKQNYEQHLRGRYIPFQKILPLLDMYGKEFKISVEGISECKRDIPLVRIGEGPQTVLGWSQMHGNESTTTKALFDLFKFLQQRIYFQGEIDRFLNTYSFYIIPMLNPDGAERYTRENANGVDLNRDAQDLSQVESQCLRAVFDKVKPTLCLNLHDQRTIYGLDTGRPATISFLSPAADASRSLSQARKSSMQKIAGIAHYLQGHLPGQIGRYEDSFNPNCVGDTFQMKGVPTILFEAGHFPEDYHREKTREFIFYSLLSLLGIIGGSNTGLHYGDYFRIPENKKNYRDFIIRNASISSQNNLVDIAIQYAEVLDSGTIVFEPIIDKIGRLDQLRGHKEKNVGGAEILTKKQKPLTVGVKVSEIVDKNDQSKIYFQRDVF